MWVYDTVTNTLKLSNAALDYTVDSDQSSAEESELWRGELLKQMSTAIVKLLQTAEDVDWKSLSSRPGKSSRDDATFRKRSRHGPQLG